jgi:short-subunit dehydrogenase
VLVNNAGIGVIGVFEATPMATVREVFETNTFGVMAMTQAVLPRFRARGSGVVVNVTSSVTLAPMPWRPRTSRARWRSKVSPDHLRTSSRPSTCESS